LRRLQPAAFAARQAAHLKDVGEVGREGITKLQ